MVQALRWRSDLPAFWPRPVLPHAQGRSLGDSCRTAVSSRTLSVALGLALLGAVFTAKNARLPILRNSLVYARIVENLETILQIGPTDIPVLITGPSGVFKTAPNPNAARLFQNWLHTREGDERVRKELEAARPLVTWLGEHVGPSTRSRV